MRLRWQKGRDIRQLFHTDPGKLKIPSLRILLLPLTQGRLRLAHRADLSVWQNIISFSESKKGWEKSQNMKIPL